MIRKPRPVWGKTCWGWRKSFRGLVFRALGEENGCVRKEKRGGKCSRDGGTFRTLISDMGSTGTSGQGCSQ